MTGLLKYTGGLIESNTQGKEDRIVSGVYTSNTVDLYGHIVDKGAMLNALSEYRKWGTIREMHETPIGVAKSIGTPNWNNIEARVGRSSRGDEVLRLVEDGVYKAFSVGILATGGEFIPFSKMTTEDLYGLPDNLVTYYSQIGQIFKITDLTLIEVSIVDRPANPLARVQNVQKEFGADVSGVLPSLDGREAIDMIKDVIGRPFFTTVARNINTNNETKLDKVASEDEIIDEPLEVKVEDIAKEIDVAPIADVEAETTVANELVEAVAEDVVAEAIVIENEAPVEVEADKTDEIAAKLEKLIVAVGEIVEKLSAIDLEAIVSAGFEKLIVAPSEVAPEAKTEDVRAETPVEAEVKPFVLGEEQIKAIAAEVLVGMNEINVRKGIVNAPESKKEAPAIDLKSMTADQLSRIIAKRAVGVAE